MVGQSKSESKSEREQAERQTNEQRDDFRIRNHFARESRVSIKFIGSLEQAQNPRLLVALVSSLVSCSCCNWWPPLKPGSESSRSIEPMNGSMDPRAESREPKSTILDSSLRSRRHANAIMLIQAAPDSSGSRPRGLVASQARKSVAFARDPQG